LQTAKSQTGFRERPKASHAFLGKSAYASPGDRPQLGNIGGKVNRTPIASKFSGSNQTLQRALGVGPSGSKKKQSGFMKKMNRPLIANQVKADLLDAFM